MAVNVNRTKKTAEAAGIRPPRGYGVCAFESRTGKLRREGSWHVAEHQKRLAPAVPVSSENPAARLRVSRASRRRKLDHEIARHEKFA
jgi:hypothetical protein